MIYLLENPLPIWVAGGVLLTMAAIVYSSLRTTASLLAIVLVLLLTGLGVAAEWLYETPREAARRALREFFAAVEADDVSGVVARLAPSASEIRTDAQTLMPEFQIDKARPVGSIEVALDNDHAPTVATIECEVFVNAQHRRSGMRGGDFSDVTFTLECIDDRWLLSGYSVSKEWRRGAGELRRGR